MTWAIYDELPATVRIFRKPAANALGYIDIDANASSYFDANVTPGVLYEYRVCSLYDNGSECSNTADQTISLNTPQPRPSASAAPAYGPSNLEATDASLFMSPGSWLTRVGLTWNYGAGIDSTYLQWQATSRRTFGRVPLSPSLNRYIFSGLLADTDYQFQLCGHAFTIDVCSNAVALHTHALPPPRAPVAIHAWLTVNKEVEITFSGGDQNLSSWFEVEQKVTRVALVGLPSAASWSVIPPRINFGQRGRVIDHNDRQLSNFVTAIPYTYRVCAGNASGRTCSDAVLAKASEIVPGPPPH